MLLLALALATSAFGADDPAPSATSRIAVIWHETTFFSIPASASFLGGDANIVEATRTKDGLELHGVQFGETVLFVFDGAASYAYAVSVIPRPPSSGGGAVPNPQDLLEKRLEILTGGWLQAGSVGFSENVARQGAMSRYLSASLSGTTPQASYGVTGTESQVAGTVQELDINGWASGRWGRAAFGSAQQASGFKPVLWGQFYRSAELLLTPGDWNLDAQADAPYRFDRPSFDPQAWSGSAERQWAGGEVTSVGVLEGQAGSSQAWLPYAGGGYESGRLGAQAFIGRVAGAAANIGSAQTHLSVGPCLVTADFTTGIRGPDAGRLRAALLPYVDPGTDVFRSNGQCHAGEFVFGGGASRGGVPGPLIDPSAVLANGFASWSGGPQTVAGANFQWSLAGQDFRNYASLYGYQRWGNFEFSGNASGNRPVDQWNFNESATLRRYLGHGQSSIGISGGLAHGEGPLQLAYTGLDAALESTYLRASIGGQASLDFQFPGPVAYRVVGQLQLQPARAYSLNVYAYVDPRHPNQWNLNGGFTYSFGDALPREPLLWPFRSTKIEAVAFDDLNGNGVRDPGEPPLAGVQICVDHAQCRTTRADGRWTAFGLNDGRHRVIADASALAGAMPTNDASSNTEVGSYRTPRLAFGFRFHADLVIHAFFDRNGNGKRDLDETDFDVGSATITGPGLKTTVMLRDARAVLFQKGDVDISLDVGSLPTGFLPEKEVIVIPVQAFGRVDIDVPVQPLRSLGGRICIDQNDDGICQPSELTAGLVRVTDGREEVIADENGNFLFNDLPPATYHIRVRDEDLPPGTRQPNDLIMAVGANPLTDTSLVLVLQPHLFARRDYTVSLPRPPANTPTSAREIGGLYLRAAALGVSGAPKVEQQRKDLRRLARASRRKPSLFLVSVYCDAAAYAKDPQAATAAAMKDGTALVHWLKLDATQATVEARSPTDDEAIVDVRVYNWLQ